MNKRICFLALLNLPGFIPFATSGANDAFDVRELAGDPFQVEEGDFEKRNVAFVSRFAKLNTDWLRWTLSGAESACRHGHLDEFRRWMTLSSRFVLFQEKNTETLGDAPYIKNRLLLEYSLAHMINEKSPKSIVVTPQDVKEWLPRSKNPIFIGNEHIRQQERFRVMLIIGAGLNNYLRKKGSPPSTLRTLVNGESSSLEEKDLYFEGEKVKYVHEADFWKLRLGGDGSRDEPLRDFMPAIDYISGLKCPEIWFASNYSEKRSELFKNGQIESRDVRCRCYIKNGGIYRGSLQ